MIEVFIDCDPPTRTAQQKGVKVLGVKKVRFYKKTELKETEEVLMNHFRRYAPAVPMVGPLKLTATWTFNWFAYELPLRKAGRLPEWVPSIVDPDFDNLSKLFCDVIAELKFYKNDSHISCGTIRKGRGDRPGIHLVLEQYVTDYTPPEDSPQFRLPVQEVEL